MAGESGYLTRGQHVMRQPLTVREYHRMGETGILSKQDHVELIEGELIAMAAIGAEQAGAAIALDFLLNQALRGRGFVSVRNPLRLGEHNEPQPDVMVLRVRPKTLIWNCSVFSAST